MEALPPNFVRRRACRASCIAVPRTCVRHLPCSLLASVRQIRFFVLERRSTPVTITVSEANVVCSFVMLLRISWKIVVPTDSTTWACKFLRRSTSHFIRQWKEVSVVHPAGFHANGHLAGKTPSSAPYLCFRPGQAGANSYTEYGTS